jgi:hypothetical protein
MKSKVFIVGFCSLPFVGLILGILLGGFPIWQEDASVPLIGNIRTFEAAYARWKAGAEKNGQKNKLVLSLGYFKGLSAEFSKAHGQATLDLTDGSLIVEVSGLTEDQAFEVWLVQNRPGPGRSVKPEPGDRLIRGGALAHDGGNARLHTYLDRKASADFKLDLLVVVPDGGNPMKDGLLFASPNVLQKFYYSHDSAPRFLPTKLADLDDATSPVLLALLAPFRSLVPTLAYADTGGMPHFADLIARGEKVFFEEKFQGNGRTCGTCHPAENNLTLDPAFIATLPKKDPLFVAEFNNGLNSDKNGGRRFEIPSLMRQFGLILENVDGFDDLTSKFAMRGVPHTFAQGLSIAPAPPVFDTTSPLKLQRTGWSGDGAPGTGTLREFAIGAVTQHITRTLNRIPGVDFRLPTDAELDAMEAFILSLGRQSELDLSTLVLNDPDANAGLALFNDPSPNGGKCFFCHFNAGANHGISIPQLGVFPGIQNANFNTGVEKAAANAGLHGPLRPLDGGSGTDPFGGFTNIANLDGSFGNGTFNTPSLVEAADSQPFFHNNLVNTIEEAVEFYNGPEFNSGAFQISLGQVQVNQVAAFLRVINAKENIQSAETKLNNALQRLTLPQLQKLLRLTIADINDAIRVLRGSPLNISGLHPAAQDWLEKAKEYCETAHAPKSKAERDIRINATLTALAQAKGLIVTP